MSNFNFNKVILGGRLTTIPELKTTTNGVLVTTFSIAVNRKGTKGETDFINCQAWRNTAEFICKYFSKGSSICVTGAIQTRSWTDQQNNKRYATEVVIDEALFVDSKNESGTQYAQPTYTTGTDNNTFNNVEFEVMSEDGDLPF